jgi:hypothetical protein
MKGANLMSQRLVRLYLHTSYLGKAIEKGFVCCNQLFNYKIHSYIPLTLYLRRGYPFGDKASFQILFRDTHYQNDFIVISLLMSPLLDHRPSLWITHKENGP